MYIIGLLPRTPLGKLVGSKVLHSKYCKNYAFAPAHKMSFACSWPKKVEFKVKIDIFLTFMLFNFADGLVSTETKTYHSSPRQLAGEKKKCQL